MRNILFVASIAATTLQAALAKEAAAPQANVETPRPSFQKDAQAESNPSAPVPPKVEPNPKAKPSVKLLALHDLIVNALNKNLELKAKRLDPSIQLNRSAAAMGAFDPNWVLGYNFSETERAQNRRESLSAGGLKVLFCCYAIISEDINIKDLPLTHIRYAFDVKRFQCAFNCFSLGI